MRWMLVVVGLVIIVVGAMAVFGACQKKAVDAAIERSTAPLLVPNEPWTSDFDFTAPPGSTNLYLFRWNFEVGGTELVSGWQVGPEANFDPPRFTEAPGGDEVELILAAASDPDCETVHDETQTRLCTYPAEFELGGVHAFLVRSFDVSGGQTLVVEYVNRGADRSVFNGDALEAQYALGAFDALPIDGDLSDHLVAIY